MATLVLLAGCSQEIPESALRGPVTVEFSADGQSLTLTTESTTVRELLDEAGIELGEQDEVNPPLFTPLEEGLEIQVVRIVEETDTVLQTIPFERKIVRNESMDADADPVIVQAGATGLREETVRIVYRDGLEAERRITQSTLIEPAKDEIVMIGIGAVRGNVTFEGRLAYISDGTAVLLRGLTAFPESMETGGQLDGRVFSLSPTGGYLLFTRSSITRTTSFNNSLWVVATERGAEPLPLEVENVLWADWNPERTSPPQIAYSTAESTDLPPGWEANNDLWVGEVDVEGNSFDPEQIVEAYPATYGWWGGNYAWSPAGRYVAYSYANEVGLIDTRARTADELHVQLQRFTEYNTLLDWVWVPTLDWSTDGRYLAFTNHGSDDPEAPQFDSWVLDVTNGAAGRFVEQSGIWAHLQWSPLIDSTAEAGIDDSLLAYLQSADPLNSLSSSYTLWLMDQDGSNRRQIYPPPGEISHFPREQQFMAWSPDGNSIAFIFNDALYIYGLGSQEATRITQDDAISSHPTWAPYGSGEEAQVIETPAEPAATPTPRTSEDLPIGQ